jgi:hypothetical protein
MGITAEDIARGATVEYNSPLTPTSTSPTRQEDNNELLGFLGSIGGAGLAGLAAYYGKKTGQEDLADIAGGLTQNYGNIRSGVQAGGEFKPYTVTSGAGGASFNNGQMTLDPNATQQGLINQANTMLGGMSTGVAGLGDTGSQAFTGATQAMNANSGAFANQLGGQYNTQGQEFLNTQVDPSLQRLQTAMTTQGLQAPTQASQGLTGLQGLTGQADFSGAGTDVTGAFSGINAPNVRTGAGDFSGGLLAQAQQGLSASAPTAQSVYDQIRATQSPEEDRQRIALENRLAAQGRLGVQTDAYGGTPEQFAMDKAQAEARNAASLQAIGMADQLATSQQARATELGQLGLSGEQIQAQLNSEGFNQQMQLGQSGISAQQAQSDLDSASQARASQLAQLGMSAEQVASQLQTEGLGRTQSSAQLAAQLAQTGAGIQAQQQQLGQGLLGMGLQAQQLGGTLGAQDTAQAAQLFGIGQQASMMPSQLQGAEIANIGNLLQSSNIPYQQQLAAAQMGLGAQQSEADRQMQLTNLLANVGLSEAGLMRDLGLGQSTLTQEYIKSLGNIGAGVAGIDF